MKLQEVKYEVIDHDFDSACTSHCGYIYTSMMPDKATLLKAIGKVDYYATHIDPDNMSLVIPNGKLPCTLRLMWNGTSRIAYTIKPVQ